jgi:hypothetical protein
VIGGFVLRLFTSKSFPLNRRKVCKTPEVLADTQFSALEKLQGLTKQANVL